MTKPQTTTEYHVGIWNGAKLAIYHNGTPVVVGSRKDRRLLEHIAEQSTRLARSESLDPR